MRPALAAGARSRPASSSSVRSSTALEDDELLVEASLPAAAAGDGWGFCEVARCHGDYALVAVAAVARVSAGVYDDVRIAIGGAADRPVRATEAEAALTGARVDDTDAREAAGQAVRESLSPSDDAHASAAYRKDVAGTLAMRAIEDATRRARVGEESE